MQSFSEVKEKLIVGLREKAMCRGEGTSHQREIVGLCQAHIHTFTHSTQPYNFSGITYQLQTHPSQLPIYEEISSCIEDFQVKKQ
jgi:hypothetical protein